METQIIDWLQTVFRLSPQHALWGVVAGELTLLVAAAIVLKLVTRIVLLRVTRRLVSHTDSPWVSALVDSRFFHRISNWPPIVLVVHFLPVILVEHTALLAASERVIDLLVIGVLLLIFNSIVDAGIVIYGEFEVSRRVPMNGFSQVLKLVVFCASLIYAISVLIGKEPWVLLSGIGALTAVLLLVFKDTILGFVGGIQLIANDMLRPGDWIEMDKYGADGDVLEISLTTVKVQNWDKTITTIPTYSLISDSFKNWRGMQESGGRRIKRSVYIDVNSIRFCTPEMIQRFKGISRIRDYVEAKEKELQEYNQLHHGDHSSLADGRRMTNVGTFRQYLNAYLRQHPKIHQELTFLIRQLQPTETGLPIEIYVFSNDQVWANYENIQADIFDHIYAILPIFELRPFQSVGGHDLTQSVKLFAAAGGTSPELLADERRDPGEIAEVLPPQPISRN